MDKTIPKSFCAGMSTVLEWAPLRVFIVYHPHFSGIEQILPLYEWFGGPNRELHRGGYGVPVHFWTSFDPELPPTAFPVADDELTLVIPILDGELVGRVAWRNWLEELSGLFCSPDKCLLPWAVHAKSTQVSAVRKSQLLGSGAITAEAFRRSATEATSLKLLNTESLEVFVSYARADGSQLVNEIMQVLREYGHVKTFCDVHDIPPGADWELKLHEALSRGAALISILTDAYANRPWCRKELRSFREPNRCDMAENSWWLPPTFILDHRSGESTRSILELGSSTIAKWSPCRASMIVDQLVREILFAAHSRRRAQRFSVNSTPDKCFVNWIPDSWTVLSLSRLSHSISTVVYPGDGMALIDLERMQHLFPDCRFVSFEQLDSDEPIESNAIEAPRSVVMFSISDPPAEDLQMFGLTIKHMEDFVSRIGRLSLRHGFDIGYGGKPNAGFTEGIQNETGSIAISPRLINFLGWPYCNKLTSSQIADDLGICRYVVVEQSRPDSNASDVDPLAKLIAATVTRRSVFSESFSDIAGNPVGSVVASVFLGGQTRSYAGVLPGIIEEAMIAIRRQRPIYLIGAYGGAARELSTCLSDERAQPLSVMDSSVNEVLERRTSAIEELNELIMEVRTTKDLHNGLTWDENIELMRSMDTGRIMRLLNKGFSAVRRSQR